MDFLCPREPSYAFNAVRINYVPTRKSRCAAKISGDLNYMKMYENYMFDASQKNILLIRSAVRIFLVLIAFYN